MSNCKSKVYTQRIFKLLTRENYELLEIIFHLAKETFTEYRNLVSGDVPTFEVLRLADLAP